MKLRFFFFLIQLGFFIFLFSVPLFLLAEEWRTTVTTGEDVHEFGGPLLEVEIPLVGKWKGVNENGNNWEILRRPNHVYSIEITWMEEGKKETFRGHGLWAVRKNNFLYVDILDFNVETDYDWPIEVRNRIPNDDLNVVVEKLKSATVRKVITGAKESGNSVETKVTEFELLWMTLFNQPEAIEEARLFDQIQLARIENLQGVVKFFTDPNHAVDRQLTGKWESTDNDPDPEAYWKVEFIRRPDGTDSGVAIEEEDDTEPMLSHGMWGLRNGKYYGIELFSEGELIPFEETYLYADKIVKSTSEILATQWIDPERKVLKFLPLVITVTDKRIKKFEAEILNNEFRDNLHGLKFIRQKIK